MKLDEAKDFLAECMREELRDHAFGDSEILWYKSGRQVGGGYIGGSYANVWVSPELGGSTSSFYDRDAKQLRNCGTLEEVSRNDETGPDEYTEGVTMPGLTHQNVFEELTKD